MARKIATIRQEDLAELPRWARVAFASRCARRVQPLLLYCWPEVSPEDSRAVDDAIVAAEKAALKGIALDLSAGGEVFRVQLKAIALADEHKASKKDAKMYSCAALVAASAKHAVHSATIALIPAMDMSLKMHAFDSAGIACEVVSSDAQRAFAIASRADIELLKSKVAAEAWNNDTTTDVMIFGAIWQTGAPNGWPSH